MDWFNVIMWGGLAIFTFFMIKSKLNPDLFKGKPKTKEQVEAEELKAQIKLQQLKQTLAIEKRNAELRELKGKISKEKNKHRPKPKTLNSSGIKFNSGESYSNIFKGGNNEKESRY